MPVALPRQRPQDPAVPIVNPLYQSAPAISQAQNRPIPVAAPQAAPAPGVAPSPQLGINPALQAAAEPTPGSETDQYLSQWRSSMDATRAVIDRDLAEAFNQIQGSNAGAAQTLSQLPDAITQSYAQAAQMPAAVPTTEPTPGAMGGALDAAQGAVSSDVNLGGGGYGPLQAALDANASSMAAVGPLIQQAAAMNAAGGGSGGGGGGGGGYGRDERGLTPLQALNDQRDQEMLWHETAREDAAIAREDEWRRLDEEAATKAWERENTDEDSDRMAEWTREDDILARQMEAQSRLQRDNVLLEQGWDYGFDELEATRKSDSYDTAARLATLRGDSQVDPVQIASYYLRDTKALTALVVDGVLTPEDIQIARAEPQGLPPWALLRVQIDRKREEDSRRPPAATRPAAPSYSSRQGANAAAERTRAIVPQRGAPSPPPRRTVPDIQDQDRGVRRPAQAPTRRGGPR